MPNPPNHAVFPSMIVEQFRQDGLNTLMLSEIYIEALLVDEELADLAWEPWDAGEIDTFTANFVWMLISFKNSDQSMQVRRQ